MKDSSDFAEKQTSESVAAVLVSRVRCDPVLIFVLLFSPHCPTKSLHIALFLSVFILVFNSPLWPLSLFPVVICPPPFVS